MNEFMSSETGELLVQIGIAAIGAAFAALTGSKLYNDRTTRIQRIIINAVANGVAHTYSNYVRPKKEQHKAAGKEPSLTNSEKLTAEDTAISFAYDSAGRQGVIIPVDQRKEIRAEVVKEVARVKAAARTGPSTKGA
jgi:DUF4097 and DUF4098 domain-containing protein YvlB